MDNYIITRRISERLVNMLGALEHNEITFNEALEIIDEQRDINPRGDRQQIFYDAVERLAVKVHVGDEECIEGFLF